MHFIHYIMYRKLKVLFGDKIFPCSLPDFDASWGYVETVIKRRETVQK